ncbi:hypothetical protein EI94DRAFT_1750039 [Lactarius quietus]|nr:hypothetical protein EI94DRAFT_1750039 [Lactarius quietus]
MRLYQVCGARSTSDDDDAPRSTRNGYECDEAPPALPHSALRVPRNSRTRPAIRHLIPTAR